MSVDNETKKKGSAIWRKKGGFLGKPRGNEKGGQMVASNVATFAERLRLRRGDGSKYRKWSEV